MIRRRRALERDCLTEMTPAFEIKHKDTASNTPLNRVTPPFKNRAFPKSTPHMPFYAHWPAAPVIFASPHSGQIYPEAFIAMSVLTKKQLRRNEDIWIDRLFESAVDFGAVLLKARFPRSFVDVNRAEDEFFADINISGHNPLTQTPFSAGKNVSERARVGLGVVPLIISENTPIYTRPPKSSEIKARLNTLYHPYHAALKQLATLTVDIYGQGLLIDCHSMPGFAPFGARRPDIVLGDCHGLSCRPETLLNVENAFKAQGYSVGRNYPYAGGYVTSHYHKMVEGLETLQIEINRDLYVNPVSLTKKPGYARLKKDIDIIIQTIISTRHTNTLRAAE